LLDAPVLVLKGPAVDRTLSGKSIEASKFEFVLVSTFYCSNAMTSVCKSFIKNLPTIF